jgi:hypothetical protein
MDHTEAVRSNAAERYTIGDLPVSEVEEFERHFFECPQCSEELRVLTILAENARAVFTEQPRAVAPVVVVPESRPTTVEKVRAWWSQPWFVGPAFAAAAVVAMMFATPSIHQGGQIEQISSFPLFSASRGEETVVAPSAGDREFKLYMDKSWEDGPATFRGVLKDEANTERASFPMKDPGADHSIEIAVPVKALSAGRYTLFLQGKDSSGRDIELARYPFTLRFQ